MSMEQDSQTLLCVTGDRRLAEEWELVLLAQGLSPSLHWSAAGVGLSVPTAQAGRAMASLTAYERENALRPPERADPAEPGNGFAALAIALLLLLFHSITTQWLGAWPWFERGSADAELILGGEYWRTVTALSLHGDIGHVLSNAAALAVFLTAVSSMTGAGVGGALVLAAGALGNLVNAFMYGSGHIAVGASTAVFGAVGLLGGFAMARRRHRSFNRWRAWAPMAAALALLGFLGSSSGQRVDIWAHLFGFLAGAILALSLAGLLPRVPGAMAQRAAAAAAVVSLWICWMIALG